MSLICSVALCERMRENEINSLDSLSGSPFFSGLLVRWQGHCVKRMKGNGECIKPEGSALKTAEK
jgi:hypothetical protein